MYDVVIDFPKFKVGVTTRDGVVVEIKYLPLSAPVLPPKNAAGRACASANWSATATDPDTTFDLPVLIEGSELQRGVWDAMCAIPRGKTRTYGELARELGADRARRSASAAATTGCRS